MSDHLSATPRFNIIEVGSQSADYQKYINQFKFLEKLFWVIDNCIVKLQHKFTSKAQLSLHKIIAICHLLWLGNQIRGIGLLLNESLISQPTQLIRSLWEAKINLMYISQLPKERSVAYMSKANEELDKLLKQSKRRSRFVSAELNRLISLPSIKKIDPKIWNDTIEIRADKVRLENEYRSIYKVYSWESHLSSAAMTKYIKRDMNNIVFDPTESSELIPLSVIMASDLTLKILIEINKVLNLLSGKEIKTIKSELVVLVNRQAPPA